MANEIKIKVTSDADTKGIDKAKVSLEETAVAAELAGKATDSLGDNMTESDRKADKLGRTISSDKDQLIKLDAAILTSTASLKLLAHALADTDDAAQRIDIKKAMSKVQADLSSSLKAKKLLNVGELIDTKPDASFLSRLTSGLGESIASAPPLAIAGGLIGAALAPSIAAGIAAGITGGIGIGVIGGGIALIAKDPIIKDNAARIGKSFKDELTKSARGALEEPVKESLGKLEGLAQRSAPKIGSAFKAVAPSVSGLTDNIVALADSFTDDLVYAAGKSGPAIGALGDLIQHTGMAIGDMIHTLSNDAPQGASAIEDLDGSIQHLIQTTTGVLDGLAKFKGGLDSVDDSIDKGRAWLEDHSMTLDLTADGYKRGSEAAQLYRDGVIGAAGAANDYNHYLEGAAENTNKLTESMTNAEKAANGQKDAMAALSNELKAQSDPVFGLLDAQSKLKDAQDAYSKSVKKSGANSRDSKEALRDLAKASIDLEGKVGALGDSFNGRMSPALRSTLKAAGATDAQIDALGRQFVSAKKDGDRFAKNYKANASVSGTDGAGRRIRSITDDLRAFQGTWTATMITNYKTFGKPGSHGGLATGGISGAGMAADGNTSSGLTWVGENGPELASLPAGTRVWSAGDSARMAGGGGGSDVRLYLDPAGSGTNALAQTLFEMIRAEVRQQHGGSVQRAFGPAGISA
jgi:hypothetical protein